MDFFKPISAFNASPDQYVLKMETDKYGNPAISYAKKNIFNWIATHILNLKKYDLRNITKNINVNKSSLEGSKDETTIDNFYAGINKKIQIYDNKHPKNKIGMQFERIIAKQDSIKSVQEEMNLPTVQPDRIEKQSLPQLFQLNEPIEQVDIPIAQVNGIEKQSLPQLFQLNEPIEQVDIPIAQVNGIEKQSISQLFRLNEPIEIKLQLAPTSPLRPNEFTSKSIQIYHTLKQKLLTFPGIKVSFNDAEHTITFWHNEKEIYVIFMGVDLENYAPNITVTRGTAELTYAAGENLVVDLEGISRRKYEKREEELLRNSKAYLFPLAKPTITTNLTERDPRASIQQMLMKYDGICFGEYHKDTAPKKFIMQNMEQFKAEGVTTLYMEHLFYDSMQPLLDQYFADPAAEMPPYLAMYLHALDKEMKIENAEYNFTALVKKAKELGIRVVAIDTTISYSSGAHNKIGIEDPSKRHLAMNAVAVGIVQKEQEKQANPGKYIMLMGDGHITQIKELPTIPGVAQALGIPAIGICKSDKNMGLKIEYNVKDYKEGKIPELTACIYQPV